MINTKFIGCYVLVKCKHFLLFLEFWIIIWKILRLWHDLKEARVVKRLFFSFFKSLSIWFGILTVRQHCVQTLQTIISHLYVQTVVAGNFDIFVIEHFVELVESDQRIILWFKFTFNRNRLKIWFYSETFFGENFVNPSRGFVHQVFF